MQNPTLYKRFNELRVKLIHSTCELGEIGAEVGELTPKLAETLFRAVCFLLDFENWDTKPYKGSLDTVPLRLEVEGRLVGDYNGNLGFDGKDPHLEPTHNPVDVKVEEDGDLAFTGKSDFKMAIDPFTTFRLSEIRMFGDKETKGGIMSCGKKEKDNT